MMTSLTYVGDVGWMSHRKPHDDVMEQEMTKPTRTMTLGVINADACSSRALGLLKAYE